MDHAASGATRSYAVESVAAGNVCVLRRAAMVVIDATERPARAQEAFLHAVRRLGAEAVVMYTERMHDGLELFVRLRGSLFILGPLLAEQWEEYFEHVLRAKVAEPTEPVPLGQCAGASLLALLY